MIFGLFINVSAFARPDTSRFNLGLNLAPFYSGAPELLGDYYFQKYVGASLNFGYTYRPVRGAIKVEDNAELYELKGMYVKVGLKSRLISNRSAKIPVPFLQLLYVGSSYSETGKPPVNYINNYPPGNQK